jgi:zinc transport system substrate-binding protein
MIVMKASRRPTPAALAGIAAMTMAFLAGCSSGAAGHGGGKVDAVASFYPLKFITQRIGGEHVNVTSLTKPGVEPHDLELSPRQTAGLASADLVVYLKGLQPAVDEAVQQAGPAHVAEATAFSPLETHGSEVDGEHARDGGDEGDGGEAHEDGAGDPHIWLDPARLAKVAQGVEKELAEADPDHADDYRANAGKLAADLAKLDKDFSRGLGGYPNRTFITSHAAFGYLAERYRLDEVAISGIDPEAEPSPARLAALHRTAREKQVSTIFFESLVNPKTAQTLARDLGLKTAVLDPIEGIRDERKNDYFSVMRQNLKNLQEALKGT